MHNETQLDLIEMITRFPALQKLPALRDMVDRMPDDHELAAMTAQFDADMDASIKDSIDFDFSSIDAAGDCTPEAPLSVTALSAAKSQHTTIRLPAPVLAALKARAKATGTRYQTLLVRTLKAASTSW